LGISEDFFYYALNMDDNLVNASKTAASTPGLVPDEYILTLMEDHQDSLIDVRRKLSIAGSFDTIHQRVRYA